MQAPLSTAPSQIPPLRKDHVVISSFPFVLLEVEVEEVALDTHFRVMEVKARNSLRSHLRKHFPR